MLIGIMLYFIFIIFICLALGFYILSVKGKVRVTRFILFTLAVVLLPFIAMYVGSNFFPLAETTVPNLIGLDLYEAKAKLESQNLSYNIIEEAYQGPVKKDVVLSQNPEAGSTVKVGRKVVIVISTGRKRVVVPNLIGRPFSQVRIILEENGLLIGEKKEEINLEYNPGTVISQNPAPNEEVDIGTPVSLIVTVTTSEGEKNEEINN